MICVDEAKRIHLVRILETRGEVTDWLNAFVVTRACLELDDVVDGAVKISEDA